MLPSREEQIREFERLGESEVRYRLADFTGIKNFDSHIAKEWLLQRESVRASEAALARDKREDETLSIAREANRIASRAEISARNANIWAAIAAAIAAIAMYVANS